MPTRYHWQVIEVFLSSEISLVSAARGNHHFYCSVKKRKDKGLAPPNGDKARGSVKGVLNR